MGIKSEVISLPEAEEQEDGDIYYYWHSKNLNTGSIINYGISRKYAQFAPKLYDHEAYKVKYWI